MGYTGFVAIGNLIAGATQENYYQTVGDMGERAAEAREFYDAHKSEISDENLGKEFKARHNIAEDAAKDAVDLREKDAAKVRIDVVRTQLKNILPKDDPKRIDIRVTRKEVEFTTNPKKTYSDIDIDGTARDVAGHLGLTVDEVRTEIYRILTEGEASEEYRNHQAALDAAKRAWRLSECEKAPLALASWELW
ncbi:uncharacterized protein LDX57_010498 [Aspergillus melleus]|uniref:uncharacterized protein n=1 Tax=Aspergillus melleus TaxID=138277 RepID=UPI001E8D1EE3|nr:uncharacterized protein LDX57_010498 [Aspergillus melleus]KAH8432868.1 hypothetical protein LDX57_010498 [Aspergillus melleus]